MELTTFDPCLKFFGNFRQGEEWYKVRRILNMKMLKPKVVGEYSQQLNDVATDLLSQMKQTRDGDGVVPSIQQELFKWSLECELILMFILMHMCGFDDQGR